MSRIKAFTTDLFRLTAFIGALLLIKFWYVSLPLVLFGMYTYHNFRKGE